MTRVRHVLGAMTGTSIDGIDLALVRVEGTGLAMRAVLLAHRASGLGPLAARLRAAAEQRPMTAGDFASLALDFGDFHAVEMRAFLETGALPRPDLASIHGQTVFHRPPASWQLVNAHPVARALGCDVVFDLRGADLAHGGQGAPLTPLADWVLFRGERPRAVVNLGGFANVTHLPGAAADASAATASIRGADVCACNQLLDAAARTALGTPYDADGAAAARGRAHPRHADDLVRRLAVAAGARSLGTGDECLGWIDAARGALSPDDLLATAADAVGTVIGRHVRSLGAADALLAGGGTRHGPLVAAIERASGCPCRPCDAAGVPAEAREAAGWAVLGALAQDAVPATLPAVTGRPARTPPSAIDGTWILVRDDRARS
jgi:1,6-anhydro-N-acetylmuramate kinase